MSNLPLQNRKALVTGASRGIGAAIARHLAAAGARVAVHYGSDETAARQVCNGLDGQGHLILRANLADADASADLPHRAAEALGGLDTVVNNAGIFVPHDATGEEDAWREIWDRTIAINLTAPAMILKSAVEHLQRAGGGHLVNITSRGAFRGEPEAPAYGAAKAGLNSLTQSLALKLAPQKIHAVAVAPGWVLTDMTREFLAGPGGEAIRGQSPLNRTATAEEIAEVVTLAVSGRADALTGAVIDVNCASYFR
jgi:NAD(P)-dependent dehydrogenase (short-subunit alcohol dehydrogenase family)